MPTLSERLNEINAQAQAERTKVQTQADTASSKIATDAEAQRSEVRQDVSQTEEQYQAGIRQSREAQQIANRQRLSGAVRQFKKIDTSKFNQDYQGALGRYKTIRTDIDVSEASANSDILKQLDSARSELDTQVSKVIQSQINDYYNPVDDKGNKLARLPNGDTVDKIEYDKMPADRKQMLNNMGVDAYNIATNAEIKAIESENAKIHEENFNNLVNYQKELENTVSLLNGERVDLKAFQELTDEQRNYLWSNGLDAYNKKNEKDRIQGIYDFAKEQDNTVTLFNGDTVSKAEFADEKLTDDQRQYLFENGVEKFNTKYGNKSVEPTVPFNRLGPVYIPEGIAAGIINLGDRIGAIKPADVGEFARNIIALGTGIGLTKERLESMKPSLEAAAELIVPGVYTIKNWNDMSGGERAFMIAVDALSVIPFVGAAARGAKGARALGKGARLAGAASGIAAEGLSQIAAPVNLFMHPIGSAKGAFVGTREFLENLHPHKIPEGVLSTTNSTVKIPVNEFTTAGEATAARDKLMEELGKTGGKITLDIDGKKIEVTRSKLMDELKGGFAHTTSFGDLFKDGIIVEAKPGMAAKEQGMFFAHEPLPRFAKQSAFGKAGEKPTVFIISPKIAKDAQITSKIYRGVVELEMKFPIGYKFDKPAQSLFTRVGPEGTRIDILLVGNTLNKRQILKLKALAFIEDVKAPFKPAGSISGKKIPDAIKDGKGLTKSELDDIINEVKRAGNDDVARSLSAIRNGRIPTRQLAPSLASITGGKRASEADVRTIESRITAERAGIRASDRVPSRTPTREPIRQTERIAGRTIDRLPAVSKVRLPDRESLRTPDRIPDRIPDRVPNRVPDRIPDRIPPRVPDRIPDRVPNRIPDRIPSRIPPRVPTKPPIRITKVKLPDNKSTTLTSEQKQGSVAWKQGFIYKALYPPYGPDNILNTREPIEGVRYLAGFQSAYKTLVLRGGTMPKSILRDMGIMDIQITSTRGKRPTMRFKRDIHQRTNYTGMSRIRR